MRCSHGLIFPFLLTVGPLSVRDFPCGFRHRSRPRRAGSAAGASEIARGFLFRVDYLESHVHRMKESDAVTMRCRIREDAAYLIGWMAA